MEKADLAVEELQSILNDMHKRRKECSKQLDPLILRSRDYIQRGLQCPEIIDEIIVLTEETARITEHIGLLNRTMETAL